MASGIPGGPGPVELVIPITVVDNTTPASEIAVKSLLFGSTLHQIMTLGHQQYPDKFSFEVVESSPYGSFVTRINGVPSDTSTIGLYWMVYGKDGKQLQTGIDQTYPTFDDSYTWKYEASHPHQRQIDDAAKLNKATKPIQNPIVVTFSAVNERNPKWPAVQNLPVIATAGSNLGEVMAQAQKQHPEKFKFTTATDTSHGTYVKSINDLPNEDPWHWLVYDGEVLLRTGLDNTIPRNKDAYTWQYTKQTH
ncbi:uncharacterized protein [Amphiura filiformis]|uniref:uncharacterized protein n=1 Tax=Amphiura filiformis TaxID=82378 RepID=UPI003B22803F